PGDADHDGRNDRNIEAPALQCTGEFRKAQRNQDKDAEVVCVQRESDNGGEKNESSRALFAAASGALPREKRERIEAEKKTVRPCFRGIEQARRERRKGHRNQRR